MRLVAALGLLLAIVGGMLALTEVDTLRSTGVTSGGGSSTFFGQLTGLWLILVVVTIIGALGAIALIMSKR